MLDALLSWAAPWLAPLFTLGGSDFTAIELLAVLISLAMVVCNMRVHPAGWPLAIASSLIYALVFANARLYGEAGLQLFFVAMALWGWWAWLRGTGDDGAPLRVHRLGPRAALLTAGATLLAWPLLALLLARGTDSPTPWMDALPTVGSIAGTLLLGRKLIENWLVWIAVNLFSIVLFMFKGLWLTAGLYALFAAMAVAGWQAWRRLGPLHVG